MPNPRGVQSFFRIPHPPMLSRQQANLSWYGSATVPHRCFAFRPHLLRLPKGSNLTGFRPPVKGSHTSVSHTLVLSTPEADKMTTNRWTFNKWFVLWLLNYVNMEPNSFVIILWARLAHMKTPPQEAWSIATAQALWGFPTFFHDTCPQRPLLGAFLM